MPKRPASPDAKASPASKKKAYSVHFNPAWSEEFPWVKKSSKSVHAIYFDFKDMNAARGIKFAGPHYLNTLKTPAEVMPFK